MRGSRFRQALVVGLLLAACGGSSKKTTTPPPTGGGGTRNLSGTVTYDFVPAVYVPGQGGGLAFNQAAQRPVRNAVVQVYRGTTVLATTATDATGHYALSFTDSGTGTLFVAALAKTATMPVIQVQDNTDGNAVWAIGANLDATQTTQDLRATHGWTGTAYNAATRLAAPYAILDSMYTAATAFIAVRPAATFPELHVNWSPSNVPQSGNKAQGFIGTSHFTGGENPPVGQIYVLGKEGVDTDEFDAHVIVHEWGHYFEHNLSRSDSPGGPHGGGDILDPRLAFGEGYGNALASMLLPESIYADTLWNPPNTGTLVAFGFDAEIEPGNDDPNASVFSETSVMRFLYDLFDGGSAEAHDGVALGLGPIYDVLVGPQRSTQALTTVGSFITGLKGLAGTTPQVSAAIDALAAHYNIGPITSDFGAGDNNLLAMYAPVSALTSCGATCRSTNMVLTGGYDYNKWHQNQYYVFTASSNGTVTITANSTEDVGLWVFQAGTQVAAADQFLSGTETATFTATAGRVYVVSLVGFSATAADYAVALQFNGI